MNEDDPLDGDPGSMLARTWTIAANFRDPADYGIPPAPTFPAERDADGALVVFGPGGEKRVLTARRVSEVRR